jgi:hypothetical protein
LHRRDQPFRAGAPPRYRLDGIRERDIQQVHTLVAQDVHRSGQRGGVEGTNTVSRPFGEFSPGGYSMMSAAVIEVVLTLGFLLVILGSTDRRRQLDSRRLRSVSRSRSFIW